MSWSLARPALFIAALLCLPTAAAHANGRLPGATGLAFHPTDEKQLLLSLTYGLALSRDGGANWTWLCEQQIDGNGGDIDPAAVMTSDGTLVVLALTNGGMLVSRDDGCTFERPPGPLQRIRGVDLTLDPSQPGHVLALMVQPTAATDPAVPRYRSLVAHSLDHGRSWDVLSELPEGFIAQTLELAPSDTRRIYVTGTSATDPLEGMVERSDDGGLSWTQTTVRLPRGSGSLYLSAIHPRDPDRLWVRVPARGDIYGVVPAKLWVSTDGGARFEQVGETAKGGMLGFALSPDGDRIAFGGPLDGLFLAPSDASEAPSKISDLVVSCLRWRSRGLYACALEPNAPFALGLAPEATQDFVPLWHRANTCRATCMPPSSLELRCQTPWEELAPLIGADAPVCDASSSMPDASIDAGSTVAEAGLDGGSRTVTEPKPARMPRASSSRGCGVTLDGASRPWWLVAMLIVAICSRCRRPRPPKRTSPRPLP
ncbi:MAG TPA: hypothetical protein VJV78_30820 [Polyangiales bacterium]|nr:hypothetical protein [Polyangiales bacterium]